MFKVLFVCTGNICRSPTADGVMKHIISEHGLSDKIHVDSAGTHGYHTDAPPDSRSASMAKQHDIDISGLQARLLEKSDYTEFDIILAMDRGHLEFMNREKPSDSTARLEIFLDFAKNCTEKDVPDPYYGHGDDGFRYVFDLIQNGCDGLLEEIKNKNK